MRNVYIHTEMMGRENKDDSYFDVEILFKQHAIETIHRNWHPVAPFYDLLN